MPTGENIRRLLENTHTYSSFSNSKLTSFCNILFWVFWKNRSRSKPLDYNKLACRNNLQIFERLHNRSSKTCFHLYRFFRSKPVDKCAFPDLKRGEHLGASPACESKIKDQIKLWLLPIIGQFYLNDV